MRKIPIQDQMKLKPQDQVTTDFNINFPILIKQLSKLEVAVGLRNLQETVKDHSNEQLVDDINDFY